MAKVIKVLKDKKGAKANKFKKKKGREYKPNNRFTEEELIEFGAYWSARGRKEKKEDIIDEVLAAFKTPIGREYSYRLSFEKISRLMKTDA